MVNIEVGNFYIIDGKVICVCEYADNIVYAFSLVDSDDTCVIMADELDFYTIEEW